MTGRRLYDAMCDEWAKVEQWNRREGNVMREIPLAWSFLTVSERRSLNRAASALTPSPARRKRV